MQTEIEIKKIRPMKLAIVMAAMYALFALIALPFRLILGFTDPNAETPVAIIVMTVLYPVIGFIGGIIMAVVFNAVASKLGGIRLLTEMWDYE